MDFELTDEQRLLQDTVRRFVDERVLPNATRIEFSGLNHGASGNTNRGGKPERVAQELRRFFAESDRHA